jgi:hypothetical protein
LSRVLTYLLAVPDPAELTSEHFTEVRHEVIYDLRIAFIKALDLLVAERLVPHRQKKPVGAGLTTDM